MKERSPFTPGRPVPAEYFTGRTEEVERLQRAISQAASGHNENLFLTGERGIGKSSLAAFGRVLAEREEKFLGAHCYLGPADALSEVTQVVVRGLLRAIAQKDRLDKIKTALGRYIESIQISLFGVSVDVEFTEDQARLDDLALNFTSVLRKLYHTIRDDRRGLVVILDDLNGVTKLPAFAHFLKSLVDELATASDPLPLLLMLVGIPERMDDLASHQPSVPRIFRVVELKPLSRDEAEDFYSRAFESVDVRLAPNARDLMVRHAGGLPVLLHEIGDAVFWEDTDDSVDLDDATRGLINAAENVGRKYLERQVYQALRSRTYRSILRKLPPTPWEPTIRRKEVMQKMTEAERRNFDNFITRMKALGVVRDGESRGEYVFDSELHRLYLYLESVASERQ